MSKLTADTPNRNKDFVQCSKLSFRNKVLEICDERQNDDWALKVYCRLQSCNDFIHVGAVYHKQCYDAFRGGQPESKEERNKKRGRPEDLRKGHVFYRLCEWLENEAEGCMFTLNELQSHMRDMVGSSNEDDIDEQIFTSKWLLSKLRSYYGDHMFFAEKYGKETVVCFRDMAGFMVQKLYREENNSSEKEAAERILKTAAKIIKSDINSMEFNTSYYPSNHEISDPALGKEWLPQSLQILLGALIPSDLKQVAIGHCILGATRPKSVIPPVPFGVGIEMDHMFGSRWLVNELHRLGFSISYDEVIKYKHSVYCNRKMQRRPC